MLCRVVSLTKLYSGFVCTQCCSSKQTKCNGIKSETLLEGDSSAIGVIGCVERD